MNPTPTFPSSVTCFLALLVCGHVLADFVFQTRGMVQRKSTHPGALAVHLAMVFVLQAGLLLPYLSPLVVALVAALVVIHGVADAVKIRWERRAPGFLAAFLVDQGLHAVSLLGVWGAWWWLSDRGTWFAVPGGRQRLLTQAAALVALYAFNGTGGSAVVTGVLRRFDLPGAVGESPNVSMGRTIGILERFLAVTLVLVGQWGALGLILAAKSIARFKDLERRAFGEYYLIGTLTSVLVATVTAVTTRALLGW